MRRSVLSPIAFIVLVAAAFAGVTLPPPAPNDPDGARPGDLWDVSNPPQVDHIADVYTDVDGDLWIDVGIWVEFHWSVDNQRYEDGYGHWIAFTVGPSPWDFSFTASNAPTSGKCEMED